MTDLKVVSFGIGDETYAVDIMEIDSVAETLKMMKLPSMPFYIKGMANLRGEIIPIIDTKKKMNVQTAGGESKDRVIVVYIKNKKIGLLVDDVKEVININREQLDKPPKTGTRNSQYIHAIAKLENDMLMVVDLNNLIDEKEYENINRLTENNQTAQ